MSPSDLRLVIQVNRSRAAAAGLDVFLFDQITDAVPDLASWIGRFEEYARRFRSDARAALTQGRMVSAAAAFQTAALCSHYATCVPGGSRDSIGALLQQAADDHRAALKASDQAFTFLAPDDDDPLFCGILERPDGVDNPPLVIVVPGLDSSKEEFALLAGKIRQRGLATLRIDGPGQGEMLLRQPAAPDYERVIGAALDAVAADRSEVGPVGAIGLSLGGYYVSRALAYEPRLQATASVTGLFRFPEWANLADPLRQILSLRCGGKRDAQWFAAAVDLSTAIERIDQPMIVVAGESDPVVAAADAHRLAEGVQNAELISLLGGDHLGANRRWEWESRVIDWLADQLRVS